MRSQKNKNIVRLLGLFLVFFMQNNDVMAQRFTEHLWENRVLLLFAPDQTDESFQSQYLAFREREAQMLDRDLLLYQVFTKHGIQPDGQAIEERTLKALREKWDVQHTAFLVVLIGKDGGTKYKSVKKIDPSVIFDLIDSMPMRQAEMRRREN